MRLHMTGQDYYDSRVVSPLIDQLMETEDYQNALSLCVNVDYCRDRSHRDQIYRGLGTDDYDRSNLIEQLSISDEGKEYAAEAFTTVTNACGCII